MSDLPCLNPSCNSYGKPHPNCRCYSNMAGGGSAGFCSANRQHEPGCQYFADGGDALPDFISDEDVAKYETPEETATPPNIGEVGTSTETAAVPAPTAAPELPDFIPDEDVSKYEKPPIEGLELPENLPDFIPDEDVAKYDLAAHYQTPGQQTLTAVEGLGQGILGPLAPFIEHDFTTMGLPGVSQADEAARQAMNPGAHAIGEGVGLVGSAALGVGEAGLIEKGLAALPEATTFFGKLGAGMLKGAVASGLIQAGDETSKAMLGLGNPEAPVANALANVGAASLFGLVGGGAGSLVSQGAVKGMRAMAAAKIGGKLESYVGGLGVAAQHAPDSAERALADNLIKGEIKAGSARNLDLASYEAGKKAIDEGVKGGIAKGGAEVAQSIGTAAGSTVGGPVGAIIGQQAGKLLAKPISAIISPLVSGAAKKVAVPAVIRMLQTADTYGLLDVLNYAEQAAKGHDLVTGAIDGVFRGARAAGAQTVNDLSDNPQRDKIREYIENGGIDQNVQQQIYQQTTPQGFADGGEVKASPAPDVAPVLQDNGIARHFPEQNILLNTAKGRISNYLNSIRPLPNQAKLAFDDEPEQTQKEKSYNTALDVANNPLGVLNEVRKGTLEPEHLRHLNAMYPEVAGHLQRKITERIAQVQIDGEKPAHHIRQGLSALMGVPLSGEFSPQGIQAAQAVFAPQTQQPGPSQGQPPAKAKRKTAPLSKSDQAYLTGSQARDARAQKV